MIINFLEPSLKISGGRRVVFSFADSLSSLGHDVRIVTINPSPMKRFVADLIRHRPAWTRIYNLKIIRVAAYERDLMPRADVVVANAWQSAIAMDKFSDEAGKKIHFIQHDERMYHGDKDSVDRSYRCKNEKIVCADWLKEMLQKDYGVTATVVSNSIDLRLFRRLKRSKPEGEIRILLLAHAYKWKGTREGVEAILSLKEQYPNIRLILFGMRDKSIEYPYDEYYYDLPQKKLAWLYSNSDIFVCPSWDEGYTLPSVEAMACGAALVTYGTGSARHYAFHNETAMVAERKNQKDLKDKIEALVKSKSLRDRISMTGYEFVKKMPSWKDRAREMEAVFRKITNLTSNEPRN